MEKELVELFNAAKKAADVAAADDGGAAAESRCLDALKELKDFPVNYQILVSTQVGKRLRSLTKHPRRRIQTFASDLIDIWKNIILEETALNKRNGNSESKSSVKVEANYETTKSANSVNGNMNDNLWRPEKRAKTETSSTERNNGNTVKIESSSSVEAVKVERITKQEKQTSNTMKKPSYAPPKLTSMIKCNDAMRDKVRELLHEALSKVPSEVDESFKEEADACDPVRVAVSVESSMFEKWGRSNGVHKFKYRSIMFNIKDQNNPDFRRKVLLGQIKPERIITLTAEEMASDERQQKNQQIKEKALFECERGGPPKATTDQFKCGRCGQRKCTYYQMQTRSADEPMTTYVTCVNCNNHWKFC